MIILGLSGGHDSNWSIVADGVVLAAYEKERFTRKRHDGGEIATLVPATLAAHNLDMDSIDLIATSEPVYPRTGPGLERLTAGSYDDVADWQWHEVEFLGHRRPCVLVPHHLAHASYARYSSGFAATAVITWDGGGDFHFGNAYACTTVSSWRGSQLEWIQRVQDSDFGSLWSVYARGIFTDRHAAGKVMGLAAFGSQRLVDPMSERFVRPLDGLLAGAQTLIDPYPSLDPPPFFDSPLPWEHPVAADAAHALQELTTRAGTSLARALHSATGHANLALAGGVALNGYLNTAVRQRAGFEDVFIPPAVDDGGLATGAALFATHHVLGQRYEPARPRQLAFLGGCYPKDRSMAAAGVDARAVDLAEAESATARIMAAGGIVGWYSGRSEHGPRALGNRSILGGAASPTTRERLNRTIKFREPFRPVAPVVVDTEAAAWFDLDWPSPYMMFIVDCRERTRQLAPSAVHFDGTARVQTVSQDSSLGRIATLYGEHTGIPLIVNTSLNVGTPIVETPEEAMQVFDRVPLDAMYLDGWLIDRGTCR
ncbi:MAG: carbamoyltransferase C-terminal domain-containing protein [Jatrophihabitantaceae bacterium]